MIENDSTPSTSIDHAPAAHVADETSAGTMLRQMREAAGVHVAVLASVLKVPQQKLEALEADSLDQLPDVTFARGLAAAVCRAFGADPAPVLARMPAAGIGLRAQSQEINQSFRRVGDRPTPMLNTGISKPLMVVVGLLLAGAALLWLLPTLPIQLSAPAAAVNSDGSINETVTPGPPVEAVAPAEPPMAAAPTEPASAPAAAASVPVSADQLLVIAATGETWVTVRDAAGKQVINRAVTAGETVSAGGPLPLSVTIGRKDAVTVKVRGQPYVMKSAGQSNVARFQVE